MKPHSIFLRSLLFFLIVFTFCHGQESIPVEITIDRDGILLQSKFYISEGTGTFPTVILLHGFPGGKGDVLGIGKTLSEIGINVLSFNYSGTHKSEGLSPGKNSIKSIAIWFLPEFPVMDLFFSQPINKNINIINMGVSINKLAPNTSITSLNSIGFARCCD
jgi:hypothetical protein